MSSLHDRLREKLATRRADGNLRALRLNNYAHDFYSNDYLGLSAFDHTETSDKVLSYSGKGSRLICGTSEESIQAEHFLAHAFNAESCLIFNSGYTANLGLLSSIPQRGDVILYDEYIHASAREGIQLSRAASYKFKHNDLSDLESKLQKYDAITFVIVESIYSMHGDYCDLTGMVELCKKYGAHLIVDEAHAGGIHGENGGGCVQELHLEKEVFARILTFGKGLGAHGACILSSNLVEDNLVNFARSFIYTTALPPSAYRQIHTIVSQTDFKLAQTQLKANIHLYQELMQDFSVDGPIQTVCFPNVSTLKDAEHALLIKDFGVKAIYAPTVPKGQERLRICIHRFNTELEIKELVKTLRTFKTN